MSDVDTLRSAGQIVAWIRSHVSEAAHLRIDSREVGRGDVFLALPGRRDDGRLHVADAVARGAAAVVTESTDGDEPARTGQRVATCVASAARRRDS